MGAGANISPPRLEGPRDGFAFPSSPRVGPFLRSLMPHLRSSCAVARRSSRAVTRGFTRRHLRCPLGGAPALQHDRPVPPRIARANVEDSGFERHAGDPLFTAGPWAHPPSGDLPRVDAPPLRAAALDFSPASVDASVPSVICDLSGALCPVEA